MRGERTEGPGRNVDRGRSASGSEGCRRDNEGE